jgi:hypothetical protein
LIKASSLQPRHELLYGQITVGHVGPGNTGCCRNIGTEATPMATPLNKAVGQVVDLLDRGPPEPSLLGEANLSLLQGRVPEGGDLNDEVSVPLDGLAEVAVERLSRTRYHSAIRQS